LTEKTGDMRVPVTVFCGFLGAGKTTLLRHLLAQAGNAGADGGSAQWAAVVNDLATVNVDGAVLREDSAGAEIVELGGGCVCCSGADDLGEAIARLAISGAYAHIWVETTGVAEPRGVAGLFTRKNPFGRTLSDYARLEALVAVVDVVALANEAQGAEGGARRVTGGSDRPIFELMVEQIECCDVVVLNQCDRATSQGGEEARSLALVKGLNPRAEIIRAEHGQVAAELFLGRTRFDAVATLGGARWIRELNAIAAKPASTGFGGAAQGSLVRPPELPATPRHEIRYGLSSMVYSARPAFDADRLAALFAAGLPGVVRAKGFFWTTRSPDEMGFVSLAGGAVRWETLSVWWAARISAGRARLEDRPPAVVSQWREPHGDRRQEIVLIGVRLNEAELRAALDGCLADQANG
jgi:G3E family GTPase